MNRRFLVIILCFVSLTLLAGPYAAAQAPVITIHEPADGAETQSQTITLHAAVTASESASLQQVQVWVNGVPVLWKDKGVDPVLPGEVSIDILLKQGKNQIAVVAIDDLEHRAERDVIVSYTPSLIQPPNLYILAIGVRDYVQDKLDLSYADADAQAIVEAFGNQKDSLFTEIKTRLLLNDQADKGNIIDGLDWLLREVTQRDSAIIFVSGHGLIYELRGDYYFLAHESDPEHIARTGVPWSEFRNVLDKLVGKTVFFVDTCHAGSITGTKSAAIDPSIIKDLITAGQGVMYMASSTGDEISRESPDWGHGAFTKAILDGLSGNADLDHNGVIYTNELDTYVTGRVKELTNNNQRPTTDMTTGYTAFPLFVLASGPVPIPVQEPVEGTIRDGGLRETDSPTFTPMPDLPATATALAATLVALVPPTDTATPTLTLTATPIVNTPTPTTIPTITPISTRMLLKADDFSSKETGWNNYTTNEAATGYENGEYFIQLQSFMTFLSVWRGGGLIEDSILQVEAKGPFEIGGASRQGIAFGWHDNWEGSTYAFTFDEYGTCKILEDINKTGWISKADGPIPEFDTDRGYHILQAVIKNDKVAGYVDGHLCIEHEMKGYTPGYVGVVAQPQGVQGKSYFDNFKIFSVP